MLLINGPAAVVTTTQAKKDMAGMFRQAALRPVYVTSDGQPVGGIVSPKDMALLEAVKADAALAVQAEERMARLHSGAARKLTSEEFEAEVKAMFGAQAAVSNRRRTKVSGR